MELGLALGFVYHVRSHGFATSICMGWRLADWERNGMHLDGWGIISATNSPLLVLSTDSETDRQPYILGGS